MYLPWKFSDVMVVRIADYLVLCKHVRPYILGSLGNPLRILTLILNTSLLYGTISQGACLPDTSILLLTTRPSWKWLPSPNWLSILKALHLNGDNGGGYFQICILIKRVVESELALRGLLNHHHSWYLGPFFN